MENIITVLSQNILPIFIVASFGFVLQRWVGIDQKTLSTAVLHILSPCLVFASLVGSELPGSELVELAVFTILTITAMGVIGLIVAKLLRLPRRDTAALLVVIMFVNGGNYGLTLNQLRYGDAGLARAVVYYTTSTVILYTLGIFISSMGELNWRQSLNRLMRFPTVYAAVLAVVVYSFNISVPAPLMRGIEIAGQGAIPVMLLVLGAQMATLHGVTDWRLTIPAISLRLIVGPLIGVAIASLMGLTGLSRSTSIIEASMPPAVFTIILATSFGLKAPSVTGIVVIATLLSPITVSLVITLFGL